MFRQRHLKMVFPKILLLFLVAALAVGACSMPGSPGPVTTPGGSESTPQALATQVAATLTAIAGGGQTGATQPAAATSTTGAGPLGTVSGFLFHDLCDSGAEGQPAPATPPPGCKASSQGGYQANGVFDPGEPGIAGATVRLGRGVCPANDLASTVTGADGRYTFTGLPAGDYCVSINAGEQLNQQVFLPGVWTFPSEPPSSVIATVVNLQAGQQFTGVDFGWDYQFLPSSPATPVPTAVPTVAPTQTTGGTAACTYKPKFVADVTIPDDTVLAPGTTFSKTWRVRNDGTCAWAAYRTALNSIVFTGGDRMSGANRVNFNHSVMPGETIDLTVDLVAPQTPGTYTGTWKFFIDKNDPPNGEGSYLGFGANADQPLYVRIIVPNPQPNPEASRVSFAEGGTTALIQGSLKANREKTYVVRAGKNQLLMLTLSSNNTVRMKVAGADGRTIAPARQDANSFWMGSLPANGDYYITLTAANQPAEFGLTVMIPSRISFEAGAFSATVDGTAANQYAVVYLLRAMKGQTMTVSVDAPANSAALEIYGLSDGTPLLRSQSEQTSWSGVLPGDQDYVIMVVPAPGKTFDFTLKTTVK